MNTTAQVSQPWREWFAVEFLPTWMPEDKNDLPPVPDPDDTIGWMVWWETVEEHWRDE